MNEEMSIGFSADVNGWRVARKMDCVVLIDLANAGKRGKKCRRIVVSTNSESVALELRYAAFKGHVDRTIGEHVAVFGEDCAHFSELRGIDVPSPTVVVTGLHVRFRFDSDDFAVKNLRDPNETTFWSDKRANVAKFTAWVARTGNAVRGLTFSEVRAALKAEGIAHESFCAVD